MNRKILASESGFTFLEMCIVIAIIGVLLSISIPNYRTAAIKAQEESCEANRGFIQKQVEFYTIDQHQYPRVDDASTVENETIQDLINVHYFQETPVCPSNGEYSVEWDANGIITVYCTVHKKKAP